MGKGSNPNSLKGLKIGWDNSELRKNPLNHKICLICNKNFIRRGKKKFTAKCCSRECIRIYRTGIPSPKKGIFNKIQKSCMACNKKFEVYPSEIRKNAGKFCSIKCRTKLWKGKNHPLYKATNRSDRNMIYNSKRYKYWRTKVFIRDEFTCVECGQIGGKLEAHHIKAYALYPKLRFITENGVTLCKPCHQKTESWLRYYGKKRIYK